jgi:hypothetical protein
MIAKIENIVVLLRVQELGQNNVVCKGHGEQCLMTSKREAKSCNDIV